VIGATDIFVSYKAEDRPRLLTLVSALEAEGFTVWWDSHIRGGADWREDIQRHLDAAKCVIVAWSRRSAGPGGDFVRDEASRARRRGAYLPIRLDRTEPPLGFGEIQAISLKGWRGDRSDARFIAIADAVRRRIAGEDIGYSTLPGEKPGISRRTIIAGGLGVGAVAAAGGGWLMLRPAPANARRIAVLPFADLSQSHDQAYFSEGVAEELRAALSRIGLLVIGRNSCDAVKDLDIRKAASKLNVANVLTGSVRRSPQTIRVSAQLVSGKDGVERWAQTYDRAPGDAIRIQTDIASNVAQALSIELEDSGRAALTLGGTTDPVAQDLLLQSRKMSRDSTGPEALRKSITLVEAAIARDPNYSDAYVARARSLTVFATGFASTPAEAASDLAEASKSANRALAIAPKLGAAQAALSGIERARLNFRGSLEHLQKALELAPDDQDVLGSAVALLPYIGHGQEGLVLADRFVALDPLNPVAFLRKAQVLYFLRRYEQSIEAGREANQLAPKVSRSWVGNSLLLLGRPADALAEFRAMSADNVFRVTGEALAAARTGDRPGAERILAGMKKQFGVVANYQYAQIRAQLGQKDETFTELDNAFASQDPGLISLEVDPFLDPIRDDQRYSAMLKKLNFP
jgi:serine/threonine-protein kinase